MEGEKNYHLRAELNTKREELLEQQYFKDVFQFFVPYTLAEIGNSLNGKKFYTSKKQEYLDGGWVATYEEKPWAIATLKSYSTRFTNNQVLESNVTRLTEEVKAWTERGVKVFALRPPTTQKMVSLEDSLSRFVKKSVRLNLEKAGAILVGV